MPSRTTRTILALSAALALTAAALAPTAVLAKGPGGNADRSGDCTAEQPQAPQQVRARDGSGTDAGAAQNVQTRAAGNGRNANTNANGNGNGRNANTNGNGNGNGRNANTNANGNGNGRNANTNGNGNGQDANGQGQNAKQGAGNGPNEDGERGPGTCDECDVEMGTLTEEQVAGLVFMANEEKMAHDVYTALAEEYGVRIFENIAAAEARHMEAVDTVIERYEIESDAVDLPAGQFSNTPVSSLYEGLMADGLASLDDAIAVGVLIEQTDIDDLKNRMTEDLKTEAPDVYEMYSHLLAGSENHLDAFQGWQS